MPPVPDPKRQSVCGGPPRSRADRIFSRLRGRSGAGRDDRARHQPRRRQHLDGWWAKSAELAESPTSSSHQRRVVAVPPYEVGFPVTDRFLRTTRSQRRLAARSPPSRSGRCVRTRPPAPTPAHTALESRPSKRRVAVRGYNGHPTNPIVQAIAAPSASVHRSPGSPQPARSSAALAGQRRRTVCSSPTGRVAVSMSCAVNVPD